MDEKNYNTIIELLAEKVRELQMEVRLLKYENESLTKENNDLKWHLNPIAKREEKDG